MKKVIFVVGMMLLAGCSTAVTKDRYEGVCIDSAYRLGHPATLEQQNATGLLDALWVKPGSQLADDYATHEFFMAYWDPDSPRFCLQDGTGKRRSCYDLGKIQQCPTSAGHMLVTSSTR